MASTLFLLALVVRHANGLHLRAGPHSARALSLHGHGHQARAPPVKMLRDCYDLVVVGGGPVGVTAALRAANLGYSAILVDGTPPRQFQFTGPTGLYSKALRDSALRLDVPVLRSMGIVDTAIWAQVCEFIETIQRKSGDNNMKALSLTRVPHLRGLGCLAPHPAGEAGSPAKPGQCAVDVAFQPASSGRSVQLLAEHVLLATGSKAVRLPALQEWYDVELGDHVRVCDSDSIKRLSFLPRKVVVVGGGIIAVEFARIFAALAADVTMLVRAKDLPGSLARVGIDRQIGSVLQRELQSAGIKLVFESEITGAVRHVGAPPAAMGGSGRRSDLLKQRYGLLDVEVVKTGTAEKREPVVADLVLTATGRTAVTGGLGLEELGIETRRNGDVVVGPDLQTSVTGVYGAGDLIGAPQLASTGISQAEAAVDAMFSRKDGGADGPQPAVVEDVSPASLLANAARYPIGIWTMPELAFVGLNAEAAAAAPHNLEVVEGIGRYSDSIRGHVHTAGTSVEGEYLGEFIKEKDEGAAAAPPPPAVIEEKSQPQSGSWFSSIFGGDAPQAQPQSPTTTQQQSPAEAAPAAEAARVLTGPALKLVVERAAPHRVVGVHVFGEDACELIHFGTTLVQGRKCIGDILAVCYAAVTYHELYKLAARDAIATLQRDAWRALYYELDADGDGQLTPQEVTGRLAELGAEPEAVDDVMKALFPGRSSNPGATPNPLGVEQFVKRAARLRSPLLPAGVSISPGVSPCP